MKLHAHQGPSCTIQALAPPKRPISADSAAGRTGGEAVVGAALRAPACSAIFLTLPNTRNPMPYYAASPPGQFFLDYRPSPSSPSSRPNAGGLAGRSTAAGRLCYNFTRVPRCREAHLAGSSPAPRNRWEENSIARARSRWELPLRWQHPVSWPAPPAEGEAISNSPSGERAPHR